MPSLRDVALGILGRTPQVAQNPNAQSMLGVIQQGDSQKGEQIARNLCQSYGVTPEQAFEQARRFFGI